MKGENKWKKYIVKIVNIYKGDIFYSKVITDFAIEHSLDRGSISMCLKNKYAQLSGWTFEYINKEKV